MVARRAILKIEGLEHEILRFNYKFQRDINSKGLPCCNFYGGELSFLLESTKETYLFEKMIHRETPALDGSIEFLSGDECVRLIEFEEAYICSYGEGMQRASWFPMATSVTLSPMRLDFNDKMLRIDRKWPRAMHGWQKYQTEEVIHTKTATEGTTIPLVTAVKGKEAALPHAEVDYSVTGYNMNVSQSDKDKVKWSVKVGDERTGTLQPERGEKIKLAIKGEWTGKEIIVMPYLNQPVERVSVKTKVEKFKKTVFFARSMKWPGLTVEGQTAEDMMCKDKTREEVLSINKLFKFQLDCTDEQLFAEMHLLFKAGTILGGNENAKALIAHFREGSGRTFSSTYMDEQLKKHPSLQEFLHEDNGVLTWLRNELKKHNGDINKMKLLCNEEIKSMRVKFNLFKDKLEGMTISVDDTSAYQIYVDDYKLYPDNIFSCKLRIVIYDHFGLDRADVEKYGFGAGFRAWYVLQHVRGYKPFLTSMECVVPVEKMSYYTK